MNVVNWAGHRCQFCTIITLYLRIQADSDKSYQKILTGLIGLWVEIQSRSAAAGTLHHKNG
jgi:hypothetical protein